MFSYFCSFWNSTALSVFVFCFSLCGWLFFAELADLWILANFVAVLIIWLVDFKGFNLINWLVDCEGYLLLSGFDCEAIESIDDGPFQVQKFAYDTKQWNLQKRVRSRFRRRRTWGAWSLSDFKFRWWTSYNFQTVAKSTQTNVGVLQTPFTTPKVKKCAYDTKTEKFQKVTKPTCSVVDRKW